MSAARPDRIVDWAKSGWRYRVLAPALAAYRFAAAQPRPVLVYQMSKVGSTSVCAALRAAGIRPLHVHFLGPLWEECRNSYRDSGTPLPVHLYVERLLRPYLRFTSHHLKIVTLSRDPIDRWLSSAFQTARRDGYDIRDVDGTVGRLRDEILAGRAVDYCVEWFDRELGQVFGVDVLAHAFDRERGYSLVEGPRVDVLTLTLERLDTNWRRLGSFVGRPVRPAWTKRRTGLAGADAYRRARTALDLSRETVAACYDHPWVRHFYTDADIATFRARWST